VHRLRLHRSLAWFFDYAIISTLPVLRLLRSLLILLLRVCLPLSVLLLLMSSYPLAVRGRRLEFARLMKIGIRGLDVWLLRTWWRGPLVSCELPRCWMCETLSLRWLWLCRRSLLVWIKVLLRHWLSILRLLSLGHLHLLRHRHPWLLLLELLVRILWRHSHTRLLLILKLLIRVLRRHAHPRLSISKLLIRVLRWHRRAWLLLILFGHVLRHTHLRLLELLLYIRIMLLKLRLRIRIMRQIRWKCPLSTLLRKSLVLVRIHRYETDWLFVANWDVLTREV